MESERSRHVLIVGGGAAGYMAAISCRERNPNCTVTILESSQQPLRKVKISGGGRCNVTHHCFEVSRLLTHYPRGGKGLRTLFEDFGPKQVVDWFQRRGVVLKTEPDGRMFPISDSSQTVVDCLMDSARRVGVTVRLGCRVDKLEPKPGGFRLTTNLGEWECRALLLSTGGNSRANQWLADLGHQMVEPVPSLFTFKVTDPRIHDLAGLSVSPVQVTLRECGLKQFGPLLITHWGFSGPAVLKLSAWGARELARLNYRAQLVVDWTYPRKHAEVRHELEVKAKGPDSSKACANTPLFGIPSRLWQRLVGSWGDHAWRHLSPKNLERLCEELRQGRFQIEGKGVFKEEFVTAGGLSLEEINLKDCQSKRVSGLFVAGELLDVDGVTGGFNFQNAWSSGWAAGRGMADWATVR